MATRVRIATDTVSDTHITDAELYLWLTSAVADTWEKILENGLGRDQVRIRYFNTVSGQQDYPVATVTNGTTVAGTGFAGISDFWKVATLYVADGSSLYRPVMRTNPVEQYGSPTPRGIISMKLAYIPAAPTFVNGTESFDGINGWEEHAIQIACTRVKNKKEDSASPFQQELRKLEERMQTHGNGSMDEPPRVIRRRTAARWTARVLPFIGGVAAWDYRGGNIELYGPSLGLYL